MGTFQSIEDARKYYADDNFAMAAGTQIDELTEDYCICSMEIKDLHRNSMGNVMGGAVFTLGDFAFSVLANDDHHPNVSLSASINYLNASRGTKLIATATRVKAGKNTGVYQVKITDDLGKDIALLVGTGYNLTI